MTSPTILHRLAETIETRKQADAGSSYVAKLLQSGQDKILKKLPKNPPKPSWHRKMAMPNMWCAKPQTSGFTVWYCCRTMAYRLTMYSRNWKSVKVYRALLRKPRAT